MDCLLTHQDLIDLIDYSPSTGIFFWKKKRRGINTEKKLGTSNGFGYLRITVLGKSHYAHRLAWFYMTGIYPSLEIDHINGDRADNKFNNLRIVTRSQNAQNRSTYQSNNKSKTLGVSWHKKSKKWQAHICIYKERKYLGLFEKAEDAHNAYLLAKQEVSYD